MLGLRLVSRSVLISISRKSPQQFVCAQRALATVGVVGPSSQPPPPAPLPFLKPPISDPKERIEKIAPSLVSLVTSYFVPSATSLNTEMRLPTAAHVPDEIRAELVRGVNKSLIRIRRDKMNKHRLKKFRKKYLSLIKHTRLKREIKKEKLFRAELLAQIKEAENFDPEKYVKNILNTIKNTPRPETDDERRERIYNLKLKHRSDVSLVPPKFEDEVPRPIKKKS